MLKPGGVWVNLGPLLYHWAAAADADIGAAEDPRYKQSVEVGVVWWCMIVWSIIDLGRVIYFECVFRVQVCELIVYKESGKLTATL